DPSWPATLTEPQTRRIRQACETEGLHLDSAFLGLAAYSYNALLHPELGVREAAEDWLRRAATLGADMGARATGGPLGGVGVGMTVTDDLKAEVVERLHRIAEHAKSVGLDAILIEPTPLPREWPHAPTQLGDLLARTTGTALPLRVVLDLGHVYFPPLYGSGAGLTPWLEVCGNRLHGLHLQQTDGLADRHWNFTRPGVIDLAAVHRELVTHAVSDRPAVLEVFYAFEQDDHEVWDDVQRGVSTAQAAWRDAAS
ncbi:TIM barrel protein, partial [Deinococcus sp.]|uniref:sugar phosphate isomerase/epimerase family protein n=1 Tax=Deinococcus sp. TaxID=47478 RepID=UPI002869C53A